MFASFAARPAMPGRPIPSGAAFLPNSVAAPRPQVAARAFSISTIQPKAPILDAMTPSVELWMGGKGPSDAKLTATGPEPNVPRILNKATASVVNTNGLSAPCCDWRLPSYNSEPTFKKLLNDGIVPQNAISVAETIAKSVEAAAASTPVGATTPAALDINFLLLVERVIDLAEAGFVCARPLVHLLTAISHLRFGNEVSDILVGQHVALAAALSGAMGYSCCKDKSSLTMEGMVRVIEAHARAPKELRLRAHPGGMAVPNRQRDLFHLFGGDITTQQAIRVLRAWGVSRARFRVAPCYYQRRYIQNTVEHNVSQLSWSDLESLPNTMVQFDWHMHSYDAMKTLRAVSQEAVVRAAAAPRMPGVLPNAAAVLVESQRVANGLGLQGCGSALSNDVETWLRDAGLRDLRCR